MYIFTEPDIIICSLFTNLQCEGSQVMITTQHCTTFITKAHVRVFSIVRDILIVTCVSYLRTSHSLLYLLCLCLREIMRAELVFLLDNNVARTAGAHSALSVIET